jgi:hypothetical protein
MTESTDPDKWPSLDIAYAFVLPSYQLLTGRFEAADSRIVSLITMASSLAPAGPVFAKAIRPNISFTSLWFITALVTFGVITFLGLLARIRGVLILPNPRILRQTALNKPEWRFKADALYLAGQHFDKNAHAINTKGNWSIALTALLVLEVGLFIVWIAR